MADDSANSCNDILAADPRRGDKSGMVIQTDQLLVHHTEFYSINVFQWVYSAIFHLPNGIQFLNLPDFNPQCHESLLF